MYIFIFAGYNINYYYGSAIWGCIMKNDEEVSFNIFAWEYIAVEIGIIAEKELIKKLCITQDTFNKYKRRIEEEKRKGD